MRTSQKGLDLIKHYEGFMPHAYVCDGNKLTIGYGHTLTVKPGDHVTEKEAEELLRQDVRTAEKVVESLVTRKLTQNQFDALVSFVFNLGEGAFKRSTLRKKVNRMDDSSAALEFLRWDKAGGKRLAGLVKRRKSESDMFLALPWRES